jgi:hypothetical protein
MSDYVQIDAFRFFIKKINFLNFLKTVLFEK